MLYQYQTYFICLLEESGRAGNTYWLDKNENKRRMSSNEPGSFLRLGSKETLQSSPQLRGGGYDEEQVGCGAVYVDGEVIWQSEQLSGIIRIISSMITSVLPINMISYCPPRAEKENDVSENIKKWIFSDLKHPEIHLFYQLTPNSIYFEKENIEISQSKKTWIPGTWRPRESFARLLW